MSNLSSPHTSGGPLSYGLPTPVRTRYKRERPLGVTALAVLSFIGAGFLVQRLFIIVFYPPYPPGGGSLYPSREELQWEAGVPTMLGIALLLVVGIGLWRLKSWGRGMALLVYGFFIATTILVSTHTLYVSALITIVACGAAFYYLCRPEVREAFID